MNVLMWSITLSRPHCLSGFIKIGPVLRAGSLGKSYLKSFSLNLYQKCSLEMKVMLLLK